MCAHTALTFGIGDIGYDAVKEAVDTAIAFIIGLQRVGDCFEKLAAHLRFFTSSAVRNGAPTDLSAALLGPRIIARSVRAYSEPMIMCLIDSIHHVPSTLPPHPANVAV